MQLTRWEPFGYRSPWSSLTRLQDRMNRMFDDMFPSDEENQGIQWMPRVNVTDMEDKLEVSAELPGMNKDDVRIEMHNGTLSISGEKHDDFEQKDRNLYVSERVFGSFRRTFQLPSTVDDSKIDAAFANGVLKITLPKQEEAKPKQIKIK